MPEAWPSSSLAASALRMPTSNHEQLERGDLGLGETVFLHMVDAVGLIHAIILRMQALLLPVQMLVFGGH